MRKVTLLAIPALFLACDRGTQAGTEVAPPSFTVSEIQDGRMTGGGTVRILSIDGEEVRVTNGFTLHCDILLSNNLEINWGGNQWHLDKESLSGVNCTDDPTVNPEPPPAPFDTFEAIATGTYNGAPGYFIHFILQDAGEPSGNGDHAWMEITAPGGATILSVPWGQIVGGNIQAHYDQPHGSNVNK
ncbi:MAG TPA: hypothetical protein VFH97_01910 [Gemmatimonadales bacterium]|nr:hypothetical protein [Gemmatimonadales bacterium]